jgi:hypothetical protein
MAIARDEIFGPVMSVLPFQKVGERSTGPIRPHTAWTRRSGRRNRTRPADSPSRSRRGWSGSTARSRSIRRNFAPAQDDKTSLGHIENQSVHDIGSHQPGGKREERAADLHRSSRAAPRRQAGIVVWTQNSWRIGSHVAWSAGVWSLARNLLIRRRISWMVSRSFLGSARSLYVLQQRITQETARAWVQTSPRAGQDPRLQRLRSISSSFGSAGFTK